MHGACIVVAWPYCPYLFHSIPKTQHAPPRGEAPKGSHGKFPIKVVGVMCPFFFAFYRLRFSLVETQKSAKGRKSHLWENRPCSWYIFLSGEVLQGNFLGDSKLPHRGIGRWQVSKHNFLATGCWFLGFYTLYQFWHVYPIVRWCYTRRFLAQHSVAMLEQCWNYSKQFCNNDATLCCTKIMSCNTILTGS